MSGIYIKGMEMPKSCSDCFAEQRIGSDFGCGVIGFEDGNTTCFTNERREDCPLVAVPDHGGLVDANRLIDIALHLMHTAKNDDIANGVKWLWQYILEAPTIIPADKGGSDDV